MMPNALGCSGLAISRFTLGCCFFGSVISETDSRRLLDHALDSGINALDTAESYGPPPGTSEAFLGRHLKARRDRVVISTKVGPTRAWLADPAEQGLTRRVIARVVEASLRRLQTDYIDILYAHFPCPVTPLEETLGAFDELVRAGKVRAIGLSNHSASQVVEALWIADSNGYAPLVVTQDLYNLFERVNEWDLYPLCQRHGLGVVAYAVLAGGLLCGNYSLDMVRDHGKIPSWRRAAYYGRRHEEHAPTRSSPKLTERTVSAVAKLETWAAARGVTASQAATAWALSHPAVTSVLLGVSNCAQFDANLAALDLKLSDDERAEIGRLVPRECVNMVAPTW
jgi:aryl-alcohol dehydrogenase-like predicted oxidoreductase